MQLHYQPCKAWYGYKAFSAESKISAKDVRMSELSTNSERHAFDRAMAMEATGQNQYAAQASKDYWNMVGPYGGITAAQVAQAVLHHPQRLGDLVAITVNYAGAVGERPYVIEAIPARTNRSTQHWIITLREQDAQGQWSTTTTATAMTALARETWSDDEYAMPEVPPASAVERYTTDFRVEWLNRYNIRPLLGGYPTEWDGAASPSLTRMWVGDEPPRPLDVPALTSLCDVFFPRIWLRRAKRVPVGTVSLTVYVHASAEQLAAVGTQPVLAQAQGQGFRDGFFDQTAQIWSPQGVLLATSHQLVYYKE